MPGFAEQMAEFGSQKEVKLGAQIEAFVDKAVPDFTHMTVLLYLVKETREGQTVGAITKVTGDAKAVVQAVLDRFERLGLLRVSEGFLSRKYAYERENQQAAMVSRLIKLWEHRETHHLILNRVLAPKA
jgi:hypothetical protein